MSLSPAKKIFVIAGEASGDLHGARLIEELKKEASRRRVGLEIHGVGGEKILQTGAFSFYNLAHFHATGFTDAVKKIPLYKKAFNYILRDIRAARPDLVVLIDNPGFNFRLAEAIHALHIPIVYYIAPQLWAWNEKRVHKMKRWVRKVLVVFDFEKDLYETNGIPVAFVGHPLKDMIHSAAYPKNEAPLISLLPGSRKGELEMLLPVFLAAGKLIQKKIPDTSFQIIQAPTLEWKLYNKAIAKSGLGVRIVNKESYKAVSESDLAIVCSGTATLECALLGVPMIISNKASWITYILAKNLIKVPFLGLPNLILGDRRFPELLQNDAVPEKIAEEALLVLSNDELKERMKEDLKEISKRLGPPGASRNAAEKILALV